MQHSRKYQYLILSFTLVIISLLCDPALLAATNHAQKEYSSASPAIVGKQLSGDRVTLKVHTPDGHSIPINAPLNAPVSLTSQDKSIHVVFVAKKNGKTISISLYHNAKDEKPFDSANYRQSINNLSQQDNTVSLGGFQFTLRKVNIVHKLSDNRDGTKNFATPQLMTVAQVHGAHPNAGTCCIVCKTYTVCCVDCCSCGKCCVTP